MKKSIRRKYLKCYNPKNRVLFIILLMVTIGIVYFAINGVSQTGKAVSPVSKDASARAEPYSPQEISSMIINADRYMVSAKDSTSFASVSKAEKTEAEGEPATAGVKQDYSYDGYIIEFNEQPVMAKKAELDKEITKLKSSVESIKSESLALSNAKREAKLKEAASIEASIAKKEAENINALNLQEQKVSSEHKKAIPLIEKASSGVKVSREYKKVFNGIFIKVTDEDAQKIKSLPNIKAVYPNNKVSAFLMDSVPSIRAPDVWKLQDASGNSITGKGVKIAIIDTGVDYTHPDLGGCFGKGCKVAGGYDLVNYDADPIDDQGHGTHVAGIAAGNGVLKGVAPDAEIYAYKVLNEWGYGTWEAVISGIEMAVDPNGDGDFSDHADIISMSLGGQGDPDDPVSTAVDNAVNAGVIATVAAGNSGNSPNAIGSPGAARKAITIGAIYTNYGLAYFSSRGPVKWYGGIIIKPDISAPGVNICSAQHDSAWDDRKCFDESHVAISGTSMATPHVAGAAALIKQAHPDWSPAEVKMALRSYAEKDEAFSITEYGYGTLDALGPVQSSRPCVSEILTNGKIAGATSNIRGSAHCSGAGTYSLYYKPVIKEYYYTSGQWKTLSSLKGPIFDDWLYSMDTTRMNDGVYLLKLVAAENNGTAYEDYAIVEVDNFEISRIGESLNYLRGNENIYGSINLPYGRLKPQTYSAYRVEYQKESDLSWVQVCTKRTKPTGDILCQVDVSSLPNGIYYFRLSIYKDGKWYTDKPFKAAVLKEIMPGWPLELNGFPRGYSLITNTNNNRSNELVFPHFKVCGDSWCSGSSLYIFKADGSYSYLDTFYENGMATNVPSDAVPAAYTSNGENLLALSDIRMCVADFKGNFKPGWPYWMPDWSHTPVVVDGAKELGSNRLFTVVMDYKTSDLSIFGFDEQGNMLTNFPINVKKEFSNEETYFSILGIGLLRTESAPNIGIAVAEYYFDENWAAHMKIYMDVYAHEGNLIKRTYLFEDFERGVIALFPQFVLGDLNSDGSTEAVVSFAIIDHKLFMDNVYNIEAYYTYAHVISSNGDVISSPVKVQGYTPYSLAIGNLGRANPDVVMALSDTWPTTYNGQKIIAFDYAGNTLFDISLEDYNYLITGLLVGDIDSDEASEIIITHRPRWWNKMSSGIIVFDKSGSVERKIEVPTFGEVDMIYNPILSDFNNDGNADLVTQSDFLPSWTEFDTKIFAFDLSGKYKKDMDWPVWMHDTQHTAHYSMGCVPKSCRGMQCGVWPDGCGGKISCGECASGEMCNQEGMCEPATQCYDSDGGKDYFTKGRTYGRHQAGKGPEIKDWIDYCADAKNLYEFSCRSLTYPGSDPLDVWSDLYQCPIACSDGACTETKAKCQILDVYSKRTLFLNYEIYITAEGLPSGDEFGITGAGAWNSILKFKPISQKGQVTTLKSTKRISKAGATYVTQRKNNIKIIYKGAPVCPN